MERLHTETKEIIDKKQGGFVTFRRNVPTVLFDETDTVVQL